MRALALLCALATLAACGPLGVPSDWEPLGERVDAGEPHLDGLLPSIAVDPTVDRPVAAVHERVDGYKNVVRVKAWTGVAWEDLGPSFEPGNTGIGVDRTADLAVAADGTVWLAWIEDEPSRSHRELYAARWDGAAWETVGGNFAAFGHAGEGPQNDARHPSIALDSAGAPWVAWIEAEEGGASRDVHVKRWDGAAWGAVGDLATDPNDDFVSLGLDGEGRPVVVYETVPVGTSSSFVAIQRWSGAGWEELGMLNGGDAGYERAPEAAIAPNGVDLWVAYRGGSAGASVAYADHWDGAAWSPSVVHDGANVGKTTVAVDGQGRAVVTWDQQLDGQTSLHARRREADAWVDLGGEIDDEDGNNFGPALAIDASHAPIVVWDDGSTGERHALARRWTGDE